MPETKEVAVRSLQIDLKNFRTVPQPDELTAAKSIITISPDKFWALLRSLIETGYLPTENIILLRASPRKLIVKEGNRRIVALKIIFGLLKNDDLGVPTELSDKISKLSAEWKKQNEKVPCAIYELADAPLVDKIVSLAHGKGEQASRDQWNSVARARHNRDMSGGSEPYLDLLEKYIANGQNITPLQKERWAGDYPLTVLEEGIKKILPRLNMTKISELVTAYPAMPKRLELEEIIRELVRVSLDLHQFAIFQMMFSQNTEYPHCHHLPQQPQ